MPTLLRWNKREADNKGNYHICDAGRGDVRVQAPDGGSAQHPPAGRIYHRLYGSLSKKGIVSYLYICNSKRDFQRFCGLVGSVPLCVDRALGRGHAPSKASAEKNPRSRIYGGMRRPRFPVRDAVRAGTGASVWDEFSGDGILDHSGAAL